MNRADDALTRHVRRSSKIEIIRRARGAALALAMAVGVVALAPPAEAQAAPVSVNIISPTASDPRGVGGFMAPADFTLELRPVDANGLIPGLTYQSFQVGVGGLPAAVIISVETSVGYIVHVRPPAQQSPGDYDLEVAIGPSAALEPRAIHYDTDSLVNVDVSLSIDRSGSMTYEDYIGKAKQAASLFIQRMRPGDGVGVVSFSDYAIEHLKLTRITETTGAEPRLLENFEGDVSAWNFGAPWAVTSEAAHSPVNSVTDSPGGPYAANANVSVVSPPVDLSGLIHPYLTFWTRYDLENSYDVGRIFVSEDDFETSALAATYTGLVGEWTKISMSLGPWVGKQNVRFLFNLYADYTIEMDGWHIDDVEVTELDPRSAALLAVASIQPEGVTSIGSGLLQSQRQFVGVGAASGEYVVTDSPHGPYQNGADFAIVTPPIDLTNIPDPELRFVSSHIFEDFYDNGIISLSIDGGTTFTEVSRLTGTEVAYQERVFALPNAGGVSDARIEFRTRADSVYNFDGWYFDNVEVRSASDHNRVAFFDDFETDRPGWQYTAPWARFRATGDADRFHPWAIILLSDGYENTAPYVNEILPEIQKTKTRIFTIALGEGSDQDLLRSIATQTGGEFYFSPNATDLGFIYSSLAGAITGEETLVRRSGSIAQGVTDIHDVVIDSSVSQATFSFSWGGAGNVLGLELETPAGAIITSATQSTTVQYFPTGAGGVFVIQAPEVGVWKMRIIGQTVVGGAPAAPVNPSDRSGWIEIAGDTMPRMEPGPKTTASANYDAQVTAVTPLRLGGTLFDTPQLTTDTIKTLAILSMDEPVRGAQVTATLTRPDPEGPVTINLYDDGLHGDGAADDGVYGGEFAAIGAAGDYTIQISAQGGSPETFTRTTTFIADVIQPDLRDLIQRHLLGLVEADNAYNLNLDSTTDVADLVQAYLLAPPPPARKRAETGRKRLNLYAPPEVPLLNP